MADKASAKAVLIEALEDELIAVRDEIKILKTSESKILAKIELVKTRI